MPSRLTVNPTVRILHRGIMPVFRNRLMAEISPEDLRSLCAKVKARGAPARQRVAASTPGGAQVTIGGAGHFYASREAQLIDVVAKFAAR